MLRRTFASLLVGGAAALASRSALTASATRPDCPANADGITEADFREYIAAFNRSDFPGFSRFYAEDIEFLGSGGARHFFSRKAVVDFYTEVKKRMRETVTVHEVIVGPQGLLADIETELVIFVDWPEFPGSPLKKGQRIVSRNFAWYDVRDGKFQRIRSANYQRLA